jgi:hypothetical protein
MTERNGSGVLDTVRDPVSGQWVVNNPGGPGRYVNSHNRYNKETRRIADAHTAKHMKRALDITFRKFPHFYVKWGLDYIARMHGKPEPERDSYFDDLHRVEDVFERLFDDNPDSTMAVIERGIAALNLQQLEKVGSLVNKRMSTLKRRQRLPAPHAQA